MTNFIKIGIFFVVLGLVPIFSVLAGETMKELPGKSLQATPSSTGSNILEGKLLKIEGDFWMVEDLSGNQHQIHIGAETQAASISQANRRFYTGCCQKRWACKLHTINPFKVHGGGTGSKEAMIPTAPGVWFPHQPPSQ